jgi:hypothetical protein
MEGRIIECVFNPALVENFDYPHLCMKLTNLSEKISDDQLNKTIYFLLRTAQEMNAWRKLRQQNHVLFAYKFYSVNFIPL